MRYIEMAKHVLYSYKANCNELMRIRRDDKPVISSSSTFVKGRISKPVEAEVIAREQRLLVDQRFTYLLQCTQAVEFALAMVMRKRDGEITVKLFEMVYKQSTHRLYGAALELNISYATARRYNSYLVKMTAVRMGYLPYVTED